MKIRTFFRENMIWYYLILEEGKEPKSDDLIFGYDKRSEKDKRYHHVDKRDEFTETIQYYVGYNPPELKRRLVNTVGIADAAIIHEMLTGQRSTQPPGLIRHIDGTISGGFRY